MSAEIAQSEVKENDENDIQKFRPVQSTVPSPQQAGIPDSSASTPHDATPNSGPKPGFGEGGGSFKMPILKGPIRKVKSVKNAPEKASADSTTPSQPEHKNDKIKKISKVSPAEKLATPPPPYREPAWSGIPEDEYYLEVLKGGTICAKIGLNDHPFHLFGRLETNHVQLDHPSLSRYHAVLQYRAVGDNDHDPGFYLYDLGSTHGTTLNKKQIEAKVYSRIQVGHMFKLAGSTRLYILQGGKTSAAEEKGKDLTIEELKEMQLKRMEEKELLRMKDADRQEEKVEDDFNTGISWGMAEDADAESDLSHNPFALDLDDDKEAPYLKDPKKALRGFFEREGEELEYNVEEMGIGRSHQYICKVVLPLDDANGASIVAEAAVSGKKKEAVLACALEACKILDRHGVLRQAKHESKKRKDKNWAADDYYDSDDDTFLDRTGEIEKKRIKRMRKAGAEKQESLTYDKLTVQLQELEKEMKKVESDLATMADGKVNRTSEDSLDAFMDSIKSGFTDRNQRAKLKLRLVDLRKEHMKLKRLVNIAKPAQMPKLKSSSAVSTSNVTKPRMQAMIGKMHGAKKFRFAPLVSKASVSTPATSAQEQEEEEEEEDELDDDQRMDVQEDQQNLSHIKTTECSSEPSGLIDQCDNASSVLSETKPLTKDHELSKVTQKGPSLPAVKGPSLPTETTATLVRKGPMLPPNNEEHDEQKDEKLISKKLINDVETEELDEWVPPKGQTGDGRTSLNDKFGY